ncbi:hypothetical protein Hte_005160 [Hypoxylon texense]
MASTGPNNTPVLAHDPEVLGNPSSDQQPNDQERNRHDDHPTTRDDEQNRDANHSEHRDNESVETLAPDLAPSQPNLTPTVAASSSAYRGTNNSSTTIPHHANTAVWITGLPEQCTPHDILSKIRNVGKIHNFSISRPQGGMRTSAVKIAFWTQQDTDRFLDLFAKGGFRFDGVAPNVVMNRHQSAPQPVSFHSRVLHIWGPSAVVNTETLKRIFEAKCFFETDEVITHSVTGDNAWIEWRFASYLGQASNV